MPLRSRSIFDAGSLIEAGMPQSMDKVFCADTGVDGLTQGGCQSWQVDGSVWRVHHSFLAQKSGEVLRGRLYLFEIVNALLQDPKPFAESGH